MIITARFVMFNGVRMHYIDLLGNKLTDKRAKVVSF